MMVAETMQTVRAALYRGRRGKANGEDAAEAGERDGSGVGEMRCQRHVDQRIRKIVDNICARRRAEPE